ncbi:MAG: hypothetical protein SCARUB_04898, partial [Candidatus Scalindua rubra]
KAEIPPRATNKGIAAKWVGSIRLVYV